MMSNINNPIEESINPYLIFKLDINHTEKEIEELKDKMSSNPLSLFLESDESKFIEIEFSASSSIIFIKKDLVDTLNELLDNIKLSYTLSDFVNELWEMDDIEQVLSFIDIDPAPEMTKLAFPESVDKRQTVIDIIRSSFIKNYTVDDLLEKVNRKGLSSLNQLNKSLLEDFSS